MAQAIAEFDFERRRDDTYSDIIVITDPNDGDLPLNITGFSFLLTVNTEKKPIDDSNELYQVAGTILDAAGGEVEFLPSAIQADQTPASYFYDIQMIDGSLRKRTIMAGKYKYLQDITKD